jgi:hypothetical protein
VPIKLGALPPGAAITSCQMGLPVPNVTPPPGAAITWSTQVAVGGADGTVLMEIMGLTPTPLPTPSRQPTQLPGGRQAKWLDGRWLELHDLSGLYVALQATGGYGVAEVELVAGGVTGAGDPAKPETWPVNPSQP